MKNTFKEKLNKQRAIGLLIGCLKGLESSPEDVNYEGLKKVIKETIELLKERG